MVAQDPARAGRPPPGSCRVALPRRVTRRAALRLPPRERGAHAAPGRARARLVRAARHDARRRRGGSVRQGRAPARPAVPGWGRDRRAGAPRRSRGVPVPDRPRARPRLLVLGRQDLAAVRRSRPRRHGVRPIAARPISLPPTSVRSSSPSRNGCARRPSTPGSSGSRSSAAWPRTPSSGRRCRMRRSCRSSSAPTTRR